MTHDELVKRAKQAIEAVFADRSVSPEETRESLEELQGEIEIWVDSLPSDELKD